MIAIIRSTLLLLSCLFAPLPSFAQTGPAGITKPTILPLFDADRPLCTPPSGLTRVLGFAQDNEREFMNGVRRGLAAAASDRGMQFRVAQAGSDAKRQIEQVQQFRASHVGALVSAPVDAIALAPHLQQLIWSGAFVGAVVPPPATEILNAPQYLTGRALGDAAAAYIRDHLRGRANVVLLTHDSLQFLAPRFVAMRDALKVLPGVSVIADLSPATVDKQGGAAAMRTVLLAHSSVDVVLGADTVVLGALATLRAAGKARPDQFLGGIDGEPEAVAEIKAGGPYKASISLNSPMFGYALGQHGADWMSGRNVPQAMDILPSAISLTNIAQYESDLADPGRVWRDPTRRASYLRLYGNICYDTRDNYLNFPWSSERISPVR